MPYYEYKCAKCETVFTLMPTGDRIVEQHRSWKLRHESRMCRSGS
jgi:DNA-directed RNA polymerase subunit RPC12/RpoP